MFHSHQLKYVHLYPTIFRDRKFIGFVSINSYVKSDSSNFLPLPVSSVPSVFSFGLFVSYSTFGFGGLGGFVSLQNYPPYLADIYSMSSIFFGFVFDVMLLFGVLVALDSFVFEKSVISFSYISTPIRCKSGLIFGFRWFNEKTA